MTTIDTLSVNVTADTTDFRKEIADADKLAKGFGSTLTTAFTGAALRGRNLTDVVSSIGQRLSTLAVNAAFKPVSEALNGGFSNLFKGFSGLFSSSDTAGQPLNLLPFAKGGVVSTPTYFPLPSATGLMGERGAEAIMPLARGPDGALGVAMHGDAGGAPIVVQISTPDADSFRRSESEVAAALARAVGRGRRSL